MATDVFSWFKVSAQGGHAGPDSTVPYVNVLEGAMAEASRVANPQAWAARAEGLSELTVFPDIGEGLLGVRPPIPPKLHQEAQPTDSADLKISLREEILWKVIAQERFDAVASACNVPETLVLKVLEEVVEALIQLQFVKSDFRVSTRKQCLAVSAYFLWARAARQVKCADFSKHLDSQFATGSFRSLRTLWQDWSLCQDGNFISLMNPRPAVRMITAMLDAGIAKKQMLILSTPEGSPLSSQIKGMNIPSRPCEPRKLRKAHRLFFVPHGVEAKTANAATLSVVGLHWWVLLLGSSLISKGEI